ESRTKCPGERQITGLKRPLFEPFLEDKEDGRARKVADVAENVPRRLSVLVRQAERLLYVRKQSRTARMQNPTLNLILRQAAAFEKAIHKFAHAGADHFRYVFRKQNMEARIAQVKAHGIKRIRERVRFRGENFWTFVRPSGNHDCCSSIAKKNRRD